MVSEESELHVKPVVSVNFFKYAFVDTYFIYDF